MASAAAELVAEREPELRIEMTDMNRTFVGAQGLVKMALDQYTEILTTASDPRVNDWPLMDSPVPTILIVLLYLYLVVIFGPRMMVNRKPYNLRIVLVVYNAFQVVFSVGMLYEVRRELCIALSRRSLKAIHLARCKINGSESRAKSNVGDA